MISAVILNYLNPELTCRCVDTLQAAARESAVEIEIIVVDNSAPRTAEALKNTLPKGVIIIENQENCGFSKANNQGFERATGEMILVMNNDLFINAKVIKQGKQYLDDNPNTGIWAPKLTDQNGNSQRSCSRFPTITGLITEYLFKTQYDNTIAEEALRSDQPMRVDTVIGACMLIPASVLNEAEGFDEDYFFNVEDIDLCRKIGGLGYEVIFDPRCAAVHLVGASQGGYWHQNHLLHNARIQYFQKNHHPIKALLAKVCIRTGIKLRELKHKVWPS